MCNMLTAGFTAMDWSVWVSAEVLLDGADVRPVCRSLFVQEGLTKVSHDEDVRFLRLPI